MRRLGTLGEEAARRLAAVLGGQGIRAELRPEPGGGLGIWVLDEDRLDAARNVWADFEANPGAERFRAAEASPVSAEASPVSGEALPVSADSSVPAQPPGSVAEVGGGRAVWRRLPVTLGLIGVSVAVGALTKLGEGDTPVERALTIASYEVVGNRGYWEGLSDVRSGEVWRLVTPIFLHYGPWHLLFNMMWVWTLGGPIELRLGSVRLLAAVLVIAAASNLAEYWLDFGFDFGRHKGFEADIGVRPSPFFGGMSGVVFGLFGLIWMRARLLPSSGFAMPRDMVVWMLMWLLACTAGFVGPIANVAHGVGLLVGMGIGAAPRVWRRA